VNKTLNRSEIWVAFLAVLFVFVLVSPLEGQAGYEPIDQWPGIVESDDGLELEPTGEVLAVLISSSSCAGNAVDGFDAAVREMKDVLSARADSLGYSFSAIGVAVDWDVETGVRYLLQGVSTSGELDFGPWGEIAVGRDWLNSASSLFALERGARWLAVPQVFILERTVIPQETHVAVTAPRLLLQVSSGDEIVTWAEGGFPVPDLSAEPARPRPPIRE
jgi:hypothetical protein